MLTFSDAFRYLTENVEKEVYLTMARTAKLESYRLFYEQVPSSKRPKPVRARKPVRYTKSKRLERSLLENTIATRQ